MNGRMRQRLATLALPALATVAAIGCDDGTPPAPPPPACESGVICTWAGNGDPAFYGDGLDRHEAMLYWPTDLAFDPDGRAYILDWQNHRVRRVNLDDKFETVIGTGDVGDGPDTGDERTPPGVPGTDCTLNHPTDVAFAPDGTVLLVAWHNHKVRRLDPATGMVDVVAGKGPGFTGDGVPALGALFNQPKAVVFSQTTARRTSPTRATSASAVINTDGIIETVVGGAMAGFAGDGGPPLSALLAFQKPNDNPEPGGGLTIDAQERCTSSTPKTSASGASTSRPTRSRPSPATARPGSRATAARRRRRR